MRFERVYWWASGPRYWARQRASIAARANFGYQVSLELRLELAEPSRAASMGRASDLTELMGEAKWGEDSGRAGPRQSTKT